ncbi:MAG: hypothetical protein PWQ91_1460 [Eubacteriales bacterium]|nr:hypothetical protein [Eubacteriales bacterium]
MSGGKERAGLTNIILAVMGLIALVEWRLHWQLTADYFPPELTVEVVYFLVPLLISLLVLLFTRDFIPVILMYLFFLLVGFFWPGLTGGSELQYDAWSAGLSIGVTWFLERMLFQL